MSEIETVYIVSQYCLRPLSTARVYNCTAKILSLHCTGSHFIYFDVPQVSIIVYNVYIRDRRLNFSSRRRIHAGFRAYNIRVRREEENEGISFYSIFMFRYTSIFFYVLFFILLFFLYER